MNKNKIRQKGLTLVELLVAMTISLVVVAAAGYVFLGARESERALDRSSESRESGVFALRMIGQNLLNAGFYPATALPMPAVETQMGMYDSYPPLPYDPRQTTDWMNPATNWPPTAFMSRIFGCDGGKLEVASSTCSTTANASDTLVINYFTSDAMGANVGLRYDCTGSDAGNDPSNAERKKNSGGSPPTTPHTAVVPTMPPQLPIFVSNRYTLSDTKIAIGNNDVVTKSFACSGNGQSWHGKNDTAAYQPIIPGVVDMQFTYGVYSSEDDVTPQKFYTATEVSALPTLVLNGLTLPPWQRVTAVRACVLSKTLSGNTRIADAAGSTRTYLDCTDTAKDQPKGDTITRYVEVFGLRNALSATY